MGSTGTLGAHKAYLEEGSFERLDELDSEIIHDSTIRSVEEGYAFPEIKSGISVLERRLSMTPAPPERVLTTIYNKLLAYNEQVEKGFKSPYSDKDALFTYKQQIIKLMDKVVEMRGKE